MRHDRKRRKYVAPLAVVTYTASGLGTDACNGIYSPSGTSGGKTAYINANGKWLYYDDDDLNWNIADTLGVPDGDAQYNGPDGPTPVGAYTVDNGDSPGGTVS